MKFWINHFNINVNNLEESLSFYQKYFQLNETRRKQDQNNHYTIVWISDEYKKITIELTKIHSKKENYNLGDNEIHIALSTDNFDDAYNFHKENNIVCYENKKMGIYFVEDPNGYWIEILPLK